MQDDICGTTARGDVIFIYNRGTKKLAFLFVILFNPYFTHEFEELKEKQNGYLYYVSDIQVSTQLMNGSVTVRARTGLN